MHKGARWVVENSDVQWLFFKMDKAMRWHLSLDRKVPFVVTLNSKNYQDSRGQVDRLDFPYRSTIIFKNHVWEIVEVAERSDKEGEIEECQGEPTIVVFFFIREMENI